MSIIGTVLFVFGIGLMIIGTIRAVKAKTLIIALHFLGVSDTVGLGLMVISATLLGLVSLQAGFFLFLVLIVSGPLVTHVTARAYLRSRRR